VHVGLNLIYLVPGETGGMEVVARELIPALRQAAPDLRFTAFINREAAEAGEGPWIEEVPSVVVPVRARHRTEWVRGEQQLLPRMAWREGVDLVHSFASTAPGWGRFRRVVTIHDLIYRIYPEAHSGVLSLGMRMLVGLAVRRSHRVIADSRSTRDDLVRLLGVPEARIDVVPLGVADEDREPPTREPDLRARYDLGDGPLALSVSAKRPHKNLRRLLDALALIPDERRPMLVLPGYPTWHERELQEHAAAAGLLGYVRFLRWVPKRDLEGLYATSGCFVFPSLYEGFGLPVLEAMRRGLPVACSDRSALPEVVGDAALMFNPEEPRAIATAIERLLADNDLVRRLALAGRQRASRFSWEATAAGTVAVYRRALAATSAGRR
jgi:glycosyltransferase involved in cell wall biosynthesis